MIDKQREHERRMIEVGLTVSSVIGLLSTLKPAELEEYLAHNQKMRPTAGSEALEKLSDEMSKRAQLALRWRKHIGEQLLPEAERDILAAEATVDLLRRAAANQRGA